MIDIHDFSAFRKEYLGLMERVLSKNSRDVPQCEILRKLTLLRESLQRQVCSGSKRANLVEIGDASKRSIRLKVKTESSEKGDRRSSSAKKLSMQPFRTKKQIGEWAKKEVANPYDLIYQEDEKGGCAFM
jgi:serine/threonine-protein kinase RIO1